MKKIDVYNIEGKKVSDVALNDKVFGIEKNDALVHQVYVAQSANRRSGSAHTKIRSDVRGGGKKPWKQKGTGNARTGSIRNPLWRGGGVIFGPLKGKNYTQSINEKMKQKALLIALSEKARNEKIRIVENLALEQPKTKVIAGFLSTVGITKSTLIALAKNESDTYKASRNIDRVTALEAEKLNVFDVMNAEYLVVSKETLKQLDTKYTL
jgi:large subunit ribosomal protein L4